jgi:hypothetical protein
MAPSGMLRRVALVRTDVSEELDASFISVRRIGKLGTTLSSTSINYYVIFRSVLRLLVTANVVPISKTVFISDDGGDKFLRNLGSYKSYMA